MKKRGRVLIPEIVEKIEKKLKELNLKSLITPKKFLKEHKRGKHRYFSPALTKEGEMISFYARLHNNLDAKEKFLREIKFLEEIKGGSLKLKKIVPELKAWDREKDFEWMVRKYIPSSPLGYRRKAFSPPSSLIIDKITEALFEISKINFQKKSKLNLKKFEAKNYLARDVYEGLVKKGVIKKELSEEILKMIKKRMNLLERENHYFCHGDLNLGNILSDRKNIWIIDWELIHYNNFSYDIGYLWAHLWEAKRKFRNNLIKSYFKKLNSVKKEKFKKLLPVVASYISLGGIEYKKEREKKKTLEKRRRFYVNLLKNCLDFKKLIKI